jgi:hypothetical protein
MNLLDYFSLIVIAYLFLLILLNIYLFILKVKLKKKKLLLNEIELSNALVRYKIVLCDQIVSGKEK